MPDPTPDTSKGEISECDKVYLNAIMDNYKLVKQREEATRKLKIECLHSVGELREDIEHLKRLIELEKAKMEAEKLHAASSMAEMKKSDYIKPLQDICDVLAEVEEGDNTVTIKIPYMVISPNVGRPKADDGKGESKPPPAGDGPPPGDEPPPGNEPPPDDGGDKKEDKPTLVALSNQSLRNDKKYEYDSDIESEDMEPNAQPNPAQPFITADSESGEVPMKIECEDGKDSSSSGCAAGCNCQRKGCSKSKKVLRKTRFMGETSKTKKRLK